MTNDYRTRMLAAAYSFAVGAVALLAGPHSNMAWLIVCIVGLGPALVMLRLAQEQPQTISQSIQKAKR